MSNTVRRHLRLLAELQSHPSLTSDALASRLDTTPRTVRRDIARLRDLGYRIEAFGGPGGGYQLRRGRRTPPATLTGSEVVGLAAVMAPHANSSPDGISTATANALAKLLATMPTECVEQVSSIADTIGHPNRQPRPHTSVTVACALAEAIRSSRSVQFDHTSGATGAETRRTVEPRRLYERRNRWYLVADDYERNDWRTFRLDRITNVTVVDVAPKRRPLPDVTTIEITWPCNASVRLHAPLDRALRHFPHPGELHALSPNVTVLTTGAYAWNDIAVRLCGLPFAFDIIEPAELRTAVDEHIANLVDQHQPIGPAQ